MGAFPSLDEGGLVVVELRSLKQFAQLGTFDVQAMRLLPFDLMKIFKSLNIKTKEEV